MKVNSNHNLNFNAKFIRAVQIQKFQTELYSYRPKKACFVEIDSGNCNDAFALANAAHYWENDLYGANISYTALQMMGHNPMLSDKKIYALTLQKHNFEELDENKILGMAEITDADKNSIELNYIQVKPDIIYALRNQPYKKIGTRIIDSLKKIYNNKVILLTARAGKTGEFYVKNGFKCIEPEKNRYIWRR